jgi:integrase
MPERITAKTLADMVADQEVRDSEVRGFFARMGRTGIAAFEVRRQGARPIRKVIGSSDVLSPSRAREEARKILAQHTLARLGPGEKNYTLDSAWPAHRADLCRRGKSPRTIENYEQGLARLSDEIRGTSLRTLAERPEMMLAEWSRIRDRTDDRKHHRQKGHGRAAADSSARFVRALYAYAKRRLDPTLPAAPPTVDLDLSIQPAIHPLGALAPEDLPRWWRRVQALENPLRRECWLFALLSGLRSGSLLDMMWADVTPDPMFCRIRNPKGGPKKAFDLILSKPMRECLDRALELGKPHWEGDDSDIRQRWVWPGRGKSGHLDGLESDRKRIGTNAHAIRRTYAGLCVLAGVDQEMVARLLNHASAQRVTAHYCRTSTIGAALVAAQEKVSALIISGISGRGDDEAEAAYAALWDSTEQSTPALVPGD